MNLKKIKMYRYQVIIMGIILCLGGKLKAQSCPTIIGFTCTTSLPQPCIIYKTVTRISGNLSYTTTLNYGDGSPVVVNSYNVFSGSIFPVTYHTYTTNGIYTLTLSTLGPGACSSSATCSVLVTGNCESCPTYSNISTGFNRVANAPYTSANDGNFDPYWFVTKKQLLSYPTFTPIPGTETYYTGVLAYDIDPNGSWYGNASGNARFISLNSTSSSQDPAPYITTYRTYFNLPSPLPANKSYKLAMSLRADDAVYQVSLNGTDIKSPGYGTTGGMYTGGPLLLSVNSCSSSILVAGQNYIDIRVSDTYLAATQLNAEILVYQCSNLCNTTPPPPCTDCISSFAPIPGKKYLVSAWVKEKNAPQSKTSYTNPSLTILFPSISGSVGPFTASGVIIDGWQRVEGEFLIPVSATNMSIKLDCSTGDCYFDDVRVLPFDGSMKSYVYDPVTMRLVAELDERNYATLYEYDEEGKLIRVKKETEKGKMTIQENRNNTKK